MRIEIPLIRWQFIIAFMFLVISFVAFRDYQLVACLVVACTFFMWGLMEGLVEFVIYHINQLIDEVALIEEEELEDES